MKRQINKKKKKKKISPKTRKWIFGISITVGVISGLLFWFFFTRCHDDKCFYHYCPLMEVIACTFFFGMMPFAFLPEDHSGKKVINKKQKKKL
ncbi:hypothetical protein SAMN05216331_10990 [Porphyromonadaceae bacterium KH3R12]|uniref:hypothetical protein n=1 Tax=Proteiniphilum sp. TaxID=1926877 RepID=UPI00089A7E8F|nr:hypothetical protein [Proteiniphilum sp.]MDY9918943.1 hypothetical protein [Proteiniphilum sp.]OJV75919.1 MAG: hypothetical protein BGO34_01960 [Bacteroidia bacterium 44-10]SDZ90170.1 hypothetical protein SAMN05216331_10990 [Porphyromonadaceae bacterium KH3R12]